MFPRCLCEHSGFPRVRVEVRKDGGDIAVFRKFVPLSAGRPEVVPYGDRAPPYNIPRILIYIVFFRKFVRLFADRRGRRSLQEKAPLIGCFFYKTH